jgi:toxin HigB-1
VVNLKILFATEKLRLVIESPKEVKKNHGPLTEKKLRARLDDLDAANSMEDVRHLPGAWEELKGARKGQFSARLDGGLRLIVRSTVQPPPSKPDGGLDWCAIDSVTIIEIVDYHE